MLNFRLTLTSCANPQDGFSITTDFFCPMRQNSNWGLLEVGHNSSPVPVTAHLCFPTSICHRAGLNTSQSLIVLPQYKIIHTPGLHCSCAPVSPLHSRASCGFCGQLFMETEEWGQTGQEGVTFPLSLPTFQVYLSPSTRVGAVHTDLGEELAEQKLKSQLSSSLSVCTGSLSPSV